MAERGVVPADELGTQGRSRWDSCYEGMHRCVCGGSLTGVGEARARGSQWSGRVSQRRGWHFPGGLLGGRSSAVWGCMWRGCAQGVGPDGPSSLVLIH